MHPDPAFTLPPDACRTIAAEIAFTHLFTNAAVVHAPVILDAPDRLTFHLSRRNRALPLEPGTRAIASFAAPNGYISPDWYDTAGQVPTWNYVAVEAEGTIEPLDRAALIAQIDALDAIHEARLAPKPVWTRDKVPESAFEGMLGGITGFALRVETWRGTANLSQNKPAQDVAGVAAALRAIGRDDLAALVAQPPNR